VSVNVPGIIDTAIAIAGLYLVLAVFCSHVNEQIAAKLQWRGEQLYLGVLNLLVGQKGLADAVFSHPLVTSASNDKSGLPQIVPGKAVSSRPYRPSFLDSRNFSLALWDVLGRATANGDELTVDNAAKSAVAEPTVLFNALKSQVAALPAGDIQRQLAVLINDAQNDYGRLLRSTDAWFDRQMDRVSGWYKRKTQFVLILIALATVFILGIDSIRIGSRLYSDPTTRTALVTAAANAVAPRVAEQVKIGALSSPAPSITSGSSATPSPQSVANAVDDAFATVQVTTYPTGFKGGWVWPRAEDPWADVHTDALHFIGLLITVGAAGLGAPFWFGALSSLMNVRLAGNKPPSRSDPKNNQPPPSP